MSESITPKADLEDFNRGIAFEAVRDALNNEIARHFQALDQSPNGPDAATHDMAANTLVEVRQRLNPNNPEAIWVAGAIMRSYRDKIPAEAR